VGSFSLDAVEGGRGTEKARESADIGGKKAWKKAQNSLPPRLGVSYDHWGRRKEKRNGEKEVERLEEIRR